MPDGLERRYYFWRNGRLEEVVRTRSNKYGSWKLSDTDPDLVVAIEDTADGPDLKLGQAATIPLLSLALIRCLRPSGQLTSMDLGPDIPKELVDQIATVTDDAVARVVARFPREIAEERLTGVLDDRLDQVTVREGDWEAHVILQGFSSQKKEPVTKADLGILVDIRRGNTITLKVIWIQAKRDPKNLKNPLQLEDLADQLKTMAGFTKEAYGLVYTPKAVYVIRHDKPQTRLVLSKVVSDMLQCKRGDRRPSLVASTLDRNYVVEIIILDPEAKHRPIGKRQRK